VSRCVRSRADFTDSTDSLIFLPNCATVLITLTRHHGRTPNRATAGDTTPANFIGMDWEIGAMDNKYRHARAPQAVLKIYLRRRGYTVEQR